MDGPLGHDHLNLVTRLSVHEGFANGGLYGNLAFHRVGLSGMDHEIGDLSSVARSLKDYCFADSNPLELLCRISSGNDGGAEGLLQFPDSGLDQALPFFGGVQRGIFAEVLVFHGATNVAYNSSALFL